MDLTPQVQTWNSLMNDRGILQPDDFDEREHKVPRVDGLGRLGYKTDSDCGGSGSRTALDQRMTFVATGACFHTTGRFVEDDVDPSCAQPCFYAENSAASPLP